MLFNLSDSENDLAPSESILFPSCDHYYWGKEENNILLRSSVVRVLFTLSDSDNDLAPSEPILFPSCDDYYWGKKETTYIQD